MNFIVSSTTLLKPLQQLNSVLNSSNVLPILDNFLFDLDNNVLTITASDLETTMTTKVPVRSEMKGLIAVPAKMLLDTLKTLFGEESTDIVIDWFEDTYGYKVNTLI